MRWVEALSIFFLLCAVFAAVVPTVFCQVSPAEDLNEILSSPIAVVIFVIQFGLGLGLGYFSVKALKYIIAILSILALGVLLNIWRFGGLEGFLIALGWSGDLTQLTGMLTTIISLLGILTFLPIGVGFFVGAIAAAIR